MESLKSSCGCLKAVAQRGSSERSGRLPAAVSRPVWAARSCGPFALLPTAAALLQAETRRAKRAVQAASLQNAERWRRELGITLTH